MTLILVLADAALQRVPDEISSHPQIKQYASRRGKSPEEVLLDRAFHHSAMKRLAKARVFCRRRWDGPTLFIIRFYKFLKLH